MPKDNKPYVPFAGGKVELVRKGKKKSTTARGKKQPKKRYTQRGRWL